MKWLVRLLLLLILLPAIALVGAWAYFKYADLSELKGLAEKAVFDATGRVMTIDGELSLSLFPWIAFETGAITLHNAAGFGPEPMVSVQAASAGLKVMPLLRRQIEFDVLRVEGLSATVHTRADGSSNLDDLLGESAAQASAAAPVDAANESGGALSSFAIGLGGIDISDAELRLRDEQAGSDLALSEVSLHTGAIELGAPFALQAGATVDLPADGFKAQIALRTTANLDLGAQRYSAQELQLQTTLSGSALPRSPMRVELAGELAADLAAQTASAAPARLVLDGQPLEGELSLSALDRAIPAVSLRLHGDRLDVDALLGNSGSNGDDATDAQAPARAASGAAAQDAPIELPTALLRQLQIVGQIALGELVAGGMHFSDVTLELDAAEGLLRVPTITAGFYGGRIDTALALDAREDSPRYTLDAKVDGLAAQPLLRDLADVDQLLGNGDLQLNLNTRGDTVGALTAALAGNLRFALNDGAIAGVNIAAEGRKLIALFGGGDEAEAEAPRQTDFSTLSASAQVLDGVLSSQDLDMRSPLLRLGGAGDVNLPAQAVDYTVELVLAETLEGQGGQGLDEVRGLTVPVTVKSSFAELAADFPGVIKRSLREGAETALKARTDQKLAAERARAEAKLAAERAKLEERKAAREAELEEKTKAAQEKLKQRIDRDTERLEDKAKELFKKLL